MLTVVEAFSGIGSQAKALQRQNIEYEILNTIEWDIAATYAYDIIHNGEQDSSLYEDYEKSRLLLELNKYGLSLNSKEPIKETSLKSWPEEALRKVFFALKRTKNLGSITDIYEEMLPPRFDVLTYSFPCQDLSICGAWHGNKSGINRDAGNRSGMLWEVERILLERNKSDRELPTFLLMENVNNILSQAHKDNFDEWKGVLSRLGYLNQVYTLSADKFGSPQKRRRTYMISVLYGEENKKNALLEYFQHNNLEYFESNSQKTIGDILRTDYSNSIYREEADGSNPNDTPSRQKIYQNNDIVFNGKKVTQEFVNTLTTKQDRNPTAGLIDYPLHGVGKAPYRNFTPRECFMLMGFDESDFEAVIKNNFYVRKNQQLFSRERLERLAGNSIVVEVLEQIFRQINYIKSHIL